MKYLKARGGSMIFHSHGGVFARSGKERKRKIEISDATGLASPSSSRRCIAHRRSLIFPLGIFLLCSSLTTINDDDDHSDDDSSTGEEEVSGYRLIRNFLKYTFNVPRNLAGVLLPVIYLSLAVSTN